MKLRIKKEEGVQEMDFSRQGEELVLQGLEKTFQGKIIEWEPPFFEILTEGKIAKGSFYRFDHVIHIHLPEGTFKVQYEGKGTSGARGAHLPGELTAPMPGKILKVLVGEGGAVKKGDPLLILEAMKMEHSITSPLDGVVKQILFQEGDRVSQDEELAIVEGA